MNLAPIADCEGVFADGYTDDMTRKAFGAIRAATGVALVCIWEYSDDWGYGGESCIYIVKDDILHEIDSTLYSWLTCYTKVDQLPEPADWAGAARPDLACWADLPGDGWANYSLEG